VGGWARDGLFQRIGKSWHLIIFLFKIKLKRSSSLFGEIPLIEPCSSQLRVISFVVLFPFPCPSPRCPYKYACYLQHGVTRTKLSVFKAERAYVLSSS
jgi:hypothetical protein